MSRQTGQTCDLTNPIREIAQLRGPGRPPLLYRTARSCKSAAMTRSVELPLWLFLLILVFAAVTFASHFLFPSVRWFFRHRMERVVARLNKNLSVPIQPFKLARRHDMIQRLIYDPDVAQAINDHAQAEQVPQNVAFEQARRYAREIVPAFSASAYFGFAIRAARWLSRSLYQVRVTGMDEDLAQIDPQSTIVFVMNHRSNMDYVLVTYLVGERSALSYAVGEWARVWPLSFLIRAMGAYFIRRKSRDALYRKVLARYVSLATQGGVAQAMFPEGGLSLDGGLAKPRLGLLKYITDGHDADARDVVFVPVGLNYDRVLEDRILIEAHSRGQRRFRARLTAIARFVSRILWQKLRRRFDHFGVAAVGFGKPVSLRAALQQGQGTPEDLAAVLMARISDVVPALPVPVTACALLRAGGSGDVATLAKAARDVMAPDRPAEDQITDGLARLARRRLVAQSAQTWQIAPGQEEVIAFYAGSIQADSPAK